MQRTLNAQPIATRSPLNSFGTAMTATRSPLNSRSVRRTCGKKEAQGRHPEGCAPTPAMGDPSRVGATDIRVFRRSFRPTATERGRLHRPVGARF